jgi:hypothetical protein
MKNGSSSRRLPREATKYQSRRDAVSNSSNGLSSSSDVALTARPKADAVADPQCNATSLSPIPIPSIARKPVYRPQKRIQLKQAISNDTPKLELLRKRSVSGAVHIEVDVWHLLLLSSFWDQSSF